MRIIVVLEGLNDSGANRVSIDRAMRWHAAGHEVTVFLAVDADRDSSMVPAGLAVVSGPRGRRLRTGLLLALVRLIRLARHADVVVAGTEVGFGLIISWFAAQVVRRPFAVTVQSRVDHAIDNYVEPRLRRLTRTALRGADLAVCVTAGLVVGTEVIIGPGTHVISVSNAVSRDEVIAAAAAESPVVWDRSLELVVGVGRLVRQKGFDLLIRAHAQALAEGAPPHQLLLLGDGEDERTSLTDLIEELGVQRTVRLAGRVGNPHAIVGTASLFVLSSRWEGFSLCLAEALACGTACVAFDCVAGPSDVLADGRHGRLVPAEDVAALAGAIREHLHDPQELTARAVRAAGEDLTIFDPAAAADLHLRALAGLSSQS